MGFPLYNMTASTSSGSTCSTDAMNMNDLCMMGSTTTCGREFDTKLVASLQLDPLTYSSIQYVLAAYNGTADNRLQECPEGLFIKSGCPIPKTTAPTAEPTLVPTAEPTSVPTAIPTVEPTAAPTGSPVVSLTGVPTAVAVVTDVPTEVPTSIPTAVPTQALPSTPMPTPTAAPIVTTGAPPAPELEIYEKQSMAASTVTSIAAASGALPAAGSVIASSQPCNIPDNTKLPFPLHPTGIKISDSAAAGAVIFNSLIVGVFTLVMRLILLLFDMKLIPESVVPATLFDGFMDTQGMLRFPSAPLFVLQGLYQGTFLAALLLIRSPPDELSAVWVAVGVVTTLICVLIPAVVFIITKRAIPMDAIFYEDNVELSDIKEYWIGPGEWISVERNNHWINRYASVVRSYREKFVYFSTVQFFTSGLVAIAVSISATGVTCGVIKLSMAAVFISLALFCVVIMPFCRMCDNHIVAITYLVHGISLACTAVFFIGDKIRFLDVAGVLHYVVLGFLLFKVLVSLVVEIYLFVKDRRLLLQEDYRIKKASTWSTLDPIEATLSWGSMAAVPDDVPIAASKISFKYSDQYNNRTPHDVSMTSMSEPLNL